MPSSIATASQRVQRARWLGGIVVGGDYLMKRSVVDLADEREVYVWVFGYSTTDTSGSSTVRTNDPSPIVLLTSPCREVDDSQRPPSISLRRLVGRDEVDDQSDKRHRHCSPGRMPSEIIGDGLGGYERYPSSSTSSKSRPLRRRVGERVDAKSTVDVHQRSTT